MIMEMCTDIFDRDLPFLFCDLRFRPCCVLGRLQACESLCKLVQIDFLFGLILCFERLPSLISFRNPPGNIKSFSCSWSLPLPSHRVWTSTCCRPFILLDIRFKSVIQNSISCKSSKNQRKFHGAEWFEVVNVVVPSLLQVALELWYHWTILLFVQDIPPWPSSSRLSFCAEWAGFGGKILQILMAGDSFPCFSVVGWCRKCFFLYIQP